MEEKKINLKKRSLIIAGIVILCGITLFCWLNNIFGTPIISPGGMP